MTNRRRSTNIRALVFAALVAAPVTVADFDLELEPSVPPQAIAAELPGVHPLARAVSQSIDAARVEARRRVDQARAARHFQVHRVPQPVAGAQPQPTKRFHCGKKKPTRKTTPRRAKAKNLVP